jgi:hypothetical protein
MLAVPFMTRLLGICLVTALVGISFLIGIVACNRLIPSRARLERWILGAIVGTSLLLAASYLCARGGALLLAPGLLGIALTAACFLPSQGVRARGGRPGWPVLMTFAATLAWFAVPLLLRTFPIGWDPAFHTSIVESIRTLGRIPETWGPYEPGEKFNYPAALHCAIALLARIGRLRSELAFNLSFVGLGAIMLSAVLALGLRFGGRYTAVLALGLYGFTDGWGTLASHASWGGISNLAGLALMAGFFLLVTEPSRGAIGLAAAVAAATALTHHLSFLLLAFAVAWLMAIELIAERRLSTVGRAAFLSTTLAMLSAGIIVMAFPSGRFEIAHAFRFEREGITDLLTAWERMKWPLLIPGSLGLIAAMRAFRSPAQRLLPAWAVAMLGFWVTWDHVYRGAVFFISGQNYTAFTPSRGLTDSAVPLAILGAWMLARFLERFRWSAAIAATLVVALVVIGGKAEWSRLASDGAREQRFAQARQACEMVREKTPEDAVIFAPHAGEVGIWLPYLCGRELNYFPDPGYHDSAYRKAKMSAADPDRFADLVRAQRERPVYFLTQSRWRGAALGSAGSWNLYEVPP